jgi:hypothetical protein
MVRRADAHRGIVSEPVDVPLGLEVTFDGRTTFLSFERLPSCPLRRQLRDAVLASMADRGGTLSSPASARAYVVWSKGLCSSLVEHGVEVPDAARLLPGDVHQAVFAGITAPVPVGLVVGRKLLLMCAKSAGNAELCGYLSSLRLYGYTPSDGGSKPYSHDELRAVLRWAKGRLSKLADRRAAALRSMGADPDAEDAEILEVARSVLSEEVPEDDCPDQPRRGYVRWDAAPANHRWWTAQLYANGFELVPPSRTFQRSCFLESRRALFPVGDDALAAAMLVVNEFGAEGQLLTGMRLGDIRNLTSGVTEIVGSKPRAHRGVSRRGNRGAPWSGGEVLGRWLTLTAPLRRWTGTQHVWLWASANVLSRQARQVREGVVSYITERPLIMEGHPGIESPEGKRLKLSIRRLRKNWVQRGERAIGPSVRGALDPVHSHRTAWAFYRGAALEPAERLALIAESQDELAALATATQVVADVDMDGPDAVKALVGAGVDEEVAQRVVRRSVDDSGTTLCRDATHAPGQSEGTLCRRSPFACLMCPNAIHTRLHVPVLLALSASIDADRSILPAEEFVAKWSGIDYALQKILGSFSERSIEEARVDLATAHTQVELLRAAQ